MDPLDHLRIGTVALKLGFLDAAALGDAMRAITAGVVDGIEAFWIGRGLLTTEQLAQVHGYIGDRPTENVGGHLPIERGATLARLTASNNSSTLKTLPIRLDDDVTALFGVGEHAGQRYKQVGVLGEGGMGEVIAALDGTLLRRVALKRVQAKVDNREAMARRLKREAQLTGNLEHPGIVPVYDVGDQPGIGTFYTMRLVEQANLDEVLRILRAGDQAALAEFTIGRLLRIFIQVCHAVDYAHSRGVIHCDLKPANILLGGYGEVLVADWGLAYVTAEGYSYRGGTPGFMAPEQHDAEAQRLDARTDVFALGAILYELLTLQYAFEGRATAPPAAPRRRAPERDVAEEIEAICMKALALEQNARYPDAHALAADIEAFLEGTKEKERTRARAEDLVRQGQNLAEGYFELLQSRPDRLAEIRELRDGVAAHEGADEKRSLWDAEDRLTILDRLLGRTLQAATSAFEQAIDEVSNHAAAHRGLGELFASEVARAEVRRDEPDRVHYDELARRHAALSGDDGSREGTLRIGFGSASRIVLAALEEKDRRLVPTGVTPITGPELRLQPGRYALEATTARGRAVKLPVFVRAGRVVDVDLGLYDAIELDDEEVLIPGGPALLGSDGAFDAELHEAEVAPFVIARYPVSFGEYLAFIIHLVSTNARAAREHLPAGHDGHPYFLFEDGRFVASGLPGVADDADALVLPAFGITVDSVIAYAAWHSQRRGRVYRLPSEDEWEKAARGTDGRLYPWGDRFDASFCKMRDSRAGGAAPEPAGSFPIDESPYGVRDMAGSIADWTFPTPGVPPASRRQVVARGGAWSDWQQDCRLDARKPHRGGERSPRVGFRLARSVGR